jgi:acetyl esterase/lipase
MGQHMLAHAIIDWDDAYANAANIPGGADYPASWASAAAQFRSSMASAGRAELDLAYGSGERHRFDLFRPEGARKGVLVFVHGGFWMRFDKSSWSHLAAGPLAHGYHVVMPSYTLCPSTRIAGITEEVGHAITTAARRISGTILLAGHSAGGHLVTRMICRESPLSSDIQARIAHVLSISGVHDLRPLMNTAMNGTLGLGLDEARAESPALLEPLEGARLTCWVGAAERSEFVRQNALLANIWKGLGVLAGRVEEPDRHHFDIVDGLSDPEHAMTKLVCAA